MTAKQHVTAHGLIETDAYSWMRDGSDSDSLVLRYRATRVLKLACVDRCMCSLMSVIELCSKADCSFFKFHSVVLILFLQYLSLRGRDAEHQPARFHYKPPDENSGLSVGVSSILSISMTLG